MRKILMLSLALPIVGYANLQGKQGIEIVDNLSVQDAFQMSNDDKPKDSGYANFLLSMQEQSNLKALKIDTSTSPYDSGLKKNLSSLTLANSFKPVPLPPGGEVIGYTVIGSYKKNGWTGAKEFFTAPNLGVCSYSKAPFIYMQLQKTAAKYNVNNKLTTIEQEGTGKKGYLTSVSWYDTGKQNIEYRLECAQEKVDKNIQDKMITFASAIDNS